MEESQDGRSARERPAAAAARSRYVYLGKPNKNKLQPGIAPADRGDHCCGTFHPNNAISAPTEQGAAWRAITAQQLSPVRGGCWTGRMVHVPTPTPVVQ